MPIKSSKELWALHSLQEVTGFVHLDLRRHPTPLKNLTFLENLRKIGGASKKHMKLNLDPNMSYNIYLTDFHISLAVLHGGIEFAGLHRLQDSPQGNISFIESPNLCYVQTIGKFLFPHFGNLFTSFDSDAKGIREGNFEIHLHNLSTAAECRKKA